MCAQFDLLSIFYSLSFVFILLHRCFKTLIHLVRSQTCTHHFIVRICILFHYYIFNKMHLRRKAIKAFRGSLWNLMHTKKLRMLMSISNGLHQFTQESERVTVCMNECVAVTQLYARNYIHSLKIFFDSFILGAHIFYEIVIVLWDN